MYFASPVKWSLQGIQSPSILPSFTLFPETSTFQEFSLLPSIVKKSVPKMPFPFLLLFHDY